MKSQSIRKQLFVLLVPAVFGLWLVCAVASWYLTSSLAREAFDRDLLNSADSIVGRVRVKDGNVIVDLPPAARAILKSDESEKFFFNVSSIHGRLLYGDSVMPPAPFELRALPSVRWGNIAGERVRIARIQAFVPDWNGQPVDVQVAETTHSRDQFQEKILVSILVPQVILIFLSLGAVWYGILTIIRPLHSLQAELLNRTSVDLRPLKSDGLPDEVLPVVLAINKLFERSKREIGAQQQFIANAAHQLRTPLAGLKTYSSLGVHVSDPADLQRIITALDEGVDRANRIVAQLLALARANATGASREDIVSNLDLLGVVDDVLKDLTERAEAKGVKIEVEAETRCITGAPDGIRHLIANLVDNAIAYTPTGGRVNISITGADPVVLAVCDSGVGIPESEKEKVFDRFYRINGTTGTGSGLGLAIVKDVATAHGARISLNRGLDGVGTCVRVEFRPSPLTEQNRH